MSDDQEDAGVCQQCGGSVSLEFEFDAGWDAPVKIRAECSGCGQAGYVRDPDYGKNMGDVFG